MADAWSHARHDTFAISAAVGGAIPPLTVATCPQCGSLHRDLLSIQAAIRHAWTPRRPRDLRLTTLDVARLRPVLWRRLLGAIGSSHDAITRPLAIGLTSVGILGVVLTSTAPGLGGPASGAATADVTIQATRQPTAGSGDATVAQEAPSADPALALSAGSLAAGAAVFVFRRIAARARGVR